MGLSAIETDWSPLAGFIADAMGLHFPRERWADLQRGLTGAAAEFGFQDARACARWLLSAPPTKEQLQVLASHLTIGETYFFRDQRTFDILARDILPPLIQARRGREQRLRLWSAACCSGEEAYSLAILVRDVLPDWKDWQVTIRATDINPRFLGKAIAGSYSEWSFRNTPAKFRENYFIKDGNGRYAVREEIKAMVTFAHLNLVEDSYPSLATDTNAMDVIFCRNVLMYFSAGQIQRAVANLHHSLIDGGWLAVSPSETSQALFARFATRNFPGAILYQKSPPPSAETPAWSWPPAQKSTQETSVALRPVEPRPVRANISTRAVAKPASALSPLAEASALYAQGRYAETVDLLLGSAAEAPRDHRTFSLLTRTLANLGRLSDALAWCDRWIAAEKIDAAGHYLRSVILLEQGEPNQARLSLQRAVYLTPTFVLAHFALGNLARSQGRPEESARHFANARQLVTRLPADELLPESEGLTAGRLAETLAALSSAPAIS